MTDSKADNEKTEQDDRLNEAFEQMEKASEEDSNNLNEATTGPDESSSDKKKGGSSAVIFFALLLSLVAIGLGSYSVYLQTIGKEDAGEASLKIQMDALQSASRDSQQKVVDLAGRISGLNETQMQRGESLKGEVDANFSQLQSTLNEMKSRISDLDSESSTTGEDWLLAEVEYLLRMANQRVLMEKDPQGALAMFRAADDIVADARGLTAFALREAMAVDIAALEAVNLLDREGIYLRLSALVGQVNDLRQPEPGYLPGNVTDMPDENAQKGILGRVLKFLNQAVNRLATLIDFRRDEVAVSRILPPEEVYYLRQNLILKLEVSQIALLEGNNKVYSTSLKEAKNWVERYFDPQQVATIAMVESLGVLLEINVEQTLPDITASLREVRQLMSEFHQAGNE